MRKNLFAIIAMAMIGTTAHAVDGGTTVGSGGDALRELFNQARSAAAAKVEQISVCSFDVSTPQSIRDWLVKNQSTLAMDIRMSQHAWVVDSQTTCGFTNHSPQSTVYLSYPTCASTAHTLNDALFVLVHEAAHHLGIDDERQADEVARAVLYSTYVQNCSVGSSVFDPNICSSAPMTTDDARRYFKPGDVSATIGKYQFYGQVSRCVALSGCEPAKPWAFAPTLGSSKIDSMNVVLRSTGQDPYFYPRFDIVYTGNGGNNQRSEFEIGRDFLGSYPVNFYGKSYRDERNVNVSTYDNRSGADIRFRRDCLWAKWTKQETLPDGSTEKTEVVLYGTH